MRKLVFLLFAWCVANTALAQLGGNGFYRVQNNGTGRYLTFITKEAFKTADGMDVNLSQAMISKKDFENDVVKDPGSIVYISSVSGGYDLQSQGIDSYSLMGIPLVVTPTNGGYICSGTMSASGASVTKTLYDNGSPSLPEGFLICLYHSRSVIFPVILMLPIRSTAGLPLVNTAITPPLLSCLPSSRQATCI